MEGVQSLVTDMASSCWHGSASSAYVRLPQDACSAPAGWGRCARPGSRHGRSPKARACVQAVLAESEAKRSAHAQELEGIRGSRERAQAALAQAEARLEATQAALAEVRQPDLSCGPRRSGWRTLPPSAKACQQAWPRSAMEYSCLMHNVVQCLMDGLMHSKSLVKWGCWTPEGLVSPRPLP